MAKQYKTGLIITGDASGGIRAVKATEQELGKLNKGFDRGSQRARTFARESGGVSKEMAVLRRTAAPLAGVLAGMFAVNTLRGQIDFADQLQKTNLRIGASTEALSQYNYVAKLSGVEFGQLATAWQRQARRISQAAKGTGEAQQALEDLRLSASDLARLAPEQQFEAIAQAMSGVADEAEKVALAQKVWDSEGVKLLQIVNQGTDAISAMRAEADALGLTVSQQTANDMATFNDEVDRLGFAFKGVSQSVLSELVPSLTSGLQSVSGFVDGMGGASVLMDRLALGAGALASIYAGRLAGGIAKSTAEKINSARASLASARAESAAAQAAARRAAAELQSAKAMLSTAQMEANATRGTNAHTVALTQLSAARARAATAAGAHNAATNAAAAAMGRASVAARAMSAGMALIGGWPGLLIAGASAALMLSSSSDDVTESIDGLSSAMLDLATPLDEVISKFQQFTRDQREAAMVQWGQKQAEQADIAEEAYQRVIDLSTETLSGGGIKAGRAMQAFVSDLGEARRAGDSLFEVFERHKDTLNIGDEAAASVALAAGEYVNASDKAQQYGERMDDVESSSHSAATAQDTLSRSLGVAADGWDDYIGKLISSRDVIGLSAQAAAEYAAQQEGHVGVFADLAGAVAGQTNALNDYQAAIAAGNAEEAQVHLERAQRMAEAEAMAMAQVQNLESLNSLLAGVQSNLSAVALSSALVVGDAAGEASDMVQQALDRVSKQAAAIRANTKVRTANTKATRAGSKANSEAAKAAREAEKAEREQARALKSLQQQMDPLLADHETYIERIETLDVALLAGTITQMEYAEAVQWSAKQYTDAASGADDYESRVKSLVGSYDSQAQKARQLKQALADINEAYRAGVIEGPQYERMVQNVRDEMAAMADESDPIADDMAKSWEEAAKRIDETFADAFAGAFDSFDDFGDQLLDGFKRLLAELAYQATLKPIVVQMTGQMSGVMGGGGPAGGVMDMFGGGSSGGLDMGTVVKGGKMAYDYFFGSSIGSSTSAAVSYGGAGFGSQIAAGGYSAGGGFGSQIATSGTGGGFASGMAGGLYTAGAGIAGGWAGGKIGGALSDKTANSNWGASGGAAAGAAIGSVVPVIGTAIGAAIGGLIGGIADVFGGSKDTPLRMVPVRGDPGGSGWDQGIYEEGALGRVGFRDDGTKELVDKWNEKDARSVLSYIAELDTALASLASTPGELEEMKRAVSGSMGRTGSPGDLVGMFTSRYDGVLKSLGSDFKEFFDSLKGGFNETLPKAVLARESLMLMSDAAEVLSLQFDSTGAAAYRAASDLAEMAGGTQNLAALQQNYHQSMLTDAEKLEIVRAELAAGFAQLGESIPKSKEGFRDLVQAQNLNTQAGRENYIQLMALVDGFNAFKEASEQIPTALDEIKARFDELERAAKAAISAAEDEVLALYKAFKSTASQQEIALLDLAGDKQAIIAIQREKELAAIDESLRPTQERIWALQDEAQAQQEAAKAGQAYAQALAGAQDWLGSTLGSISGWIDQQNATGGSPTDNLAVSQEQFAEQLALAQAGDRDALQAITQYADRLLSSSSDMFASGAKGQAERDKVLAALEDLPNAVSAEQYIADEIKAALREQTAGITDDLGDVLTTGAPPQIAAELSGSFEKLTLGVGEVLTREQLAIVMDGKATDAQLDALMKMVDLNGDGVITGLESVIIKSLPSDTLLGNVLKNQLEATRNKQLTHAQVRSALSPIASKAIIDKLINRADKNADGIITEQELSNVRLGGLVDGIGSTLKPMFDDIDLDEDKLIDYGEFSKFFAGLATDAELRDIYSRLDADGSGTISAIEAGNASSEGVEDNTKSLEERSLEQLASLNGLVEEMTRTTDQFVGLNSTMKSLRDSINALGVAQREAARIERERLAAERAEQARIEAERKAAQQEAQRRAGMEQAKKQASSIKSGIARSQAAANQWRDSPHGRSRRAMSELWAQAQQDPAMYQRKRDAYLRAEKAGQRIKIQYRDGSWDSKHLRLGEATGVINTIDKKLKGLADVKTQQNALQRLREQYRNKFGEAAPFAKGGVFTNSVVSDPTNFNMGLMGEAGPEAIMPLKRGADGALGIRAELPPISLPPLLGGGDVVEVLQDLRREVAELRKENAKLQGEGNRHAAASVQVQQAGFQRQIVEQQKGNRSLDEMSAGARLEASR